MDGFKVIKQQIVECPFNANDTRTQVNFPTNNFLRMKDIVSIEFFTRAVMPISPVLKFQTPTSAQMLTATLSFYGANPEADNAHGIWLENIPCIRFYNIQNGTDPFERRPFIMIPRNIVWEKSFVQLSTALGEANPTSFCFLVGYTGNDGDN